MKIKGFCMIALLLSVGVHVAFAQKSGKMERKRLIDSGWKFYPGDTADAGSRTFDDQGWRDIDLPHDWSIEGAPDPKNPTKGAGGYFPSGIGWYRKSFKAPAEWKGKKIAVYFEGVYMNAAVFINGRPLGVRPYGYSSFSYDLSPYLEAGGENVIAVRVDNSKQVNSRWYSGSGIYRHVWIVATEQVHIADWGVRVTTGDISSAMAAVRIKTFVKNETRSSRNITVKAVVLTKAGPAGAGRPVRVILPPNGMQEIDQVVRVPHPLLWTPEAPDLYVAHVEIAEGGKTIDETKTSFGIRSLKYTAANGFQLNGRTIKIDGGCVHHDNGCLGAAAFDRAEERKVELLRSAGFNTVRTSHNPPSEAFLNACDSLGLMVIDEAFDCWRVGKNKFDYAGYFDKWWKADLDAMVRRDINHPSIIMWSTGNEIVERGDPEAVKTATMLAHAIRNIDSARPVTSAVVGNDKAWSAFDSLMAAHEIAGYNYHLFSAPSDHERVPARLILETESYPKDAFTNWKLVHDNNYVIGDCVWTAMDYLGEAGIGRWYYSGEVPGEHWENDLYPWHGAYCGDIDLIGRRKPVSHYRNMLYNNTEKLYMAVREPEPAPLQIKETWWSVYPAWESWTWPGQEAKPLQVEVYSKYPQVRLYLNDSLIGEKPTALDQQYKAVFSVPYFPGVLRAAGVDHEKETEPVILRTSGEAAKIRLTADRREMAADGQGLIYVMVGITDAAGIIQPNAGNRIHFELEGPGVIAGVGNADVKDTDPYSGISRKAWHGQALAIIRSTHETGDISLSATSPGLQPAVLLVRAISGK